jgi:hypothetical protein
VHNRHNSPKRNLQGILALFEISMIEAIKGSRWLGNGRARKVSFIGPKTGLVSSSVRPLEVELYQN